MATPSTKAQVLQDAGATFLKMAAPVAILAWTQHAAGQTISISADWQAVGGAVLAAGAVLWHGAPVLFGQAKAKRAATAAAKDRARLTEALAFLKQAEAAEAADRVPAV